MLGVIIEKKALISVKNDFVRIIPMSSRFNQSKVYYAYIYPAFLLIYCAQLSFTTLVH